MAIGEDILLACNCPSLAAMIVVISMAITSLDFSTALLLDNDCFVSPPCTCSPQANCSSRGLTTMPTFKLVNASGTYLNIYLDDNNLTMINNFAFGNISTNNASRVMIYLQGNRVSFMSDLCFTGIETNIGLINLTNNRLTGLLRVLGSLTNLRDLYLNGNPLKTLDSYVMDRIGKTLWILDIGLSHFDSWPKDLRFLNQLRDLRLYSIPFSSLPHNAFQEIEDTLSMLLISDSFLVEFPVAICNLSRIYHLSLYHAFKFHKNAFHLNVCHSNIESLRILSLRYNNLVDFPKVLYKGSYYYNLDLSHNNIRIIEDSLVPLYRISDLNLNNNLLTRIPLAFNRIKFLKILRLGHNQITSIEDYDLASMTQLNEIYLEYNKIQFISSNAFVNKIFLRKLYLSNNDLKTFPIALLELSRMNLIDLTDNHINCTCSDVDFKSWISSRNTIKGDCMDGQEKLQAFITQQVPKCE